MKLLLLQERNLHKCQEEVNVNLNDISEAEIITDDMEDIQDDINEKSNDLTADDIF